VFEEAQIFVSPPLLKEYRNVPLELLEKNKIDKEQFKALIAGIAAFVSKAVVISPRKKLFICRDPEDNFVLECCLEAEADIIITGDKDLLEIKNLPFSTKILTPRMYLKKP
jgi:putative PIN family toxin of toxin-antitoxin system